MTRRCFATALTAAVLAVTALTGCGADEPVVPPAAAPAASTAPSEATTAAAEDEAGSAAFVAAVRAKLPEIAADRRDEEIGLIAEQACAGLSAGLKSDQIVAETRTLGTEDASATDQATARELIKLAIDSVCADEAKRIDEF
jgi:hypothetical protein